MNMVLILTQIKYLLGQNNMKQLIILPIALVTLMSFHAVNVYHNYNIYAARENIDEIKSWIIEDINRGAMTEDIGNIYLEHLVETDSLLLDLKYCKN